jgi:hypothetical protein
MNNTPVVSLEAVDATCAAELLKLNVGNRRFRQHRCEKYTADMLAGRWKPGVSQIIILTDRLGTGIELLNGQHSLTAVIRSNTTQLFTILRTTDRSAFMVVDTGLGRQAGDVLAQEGAPSANVAAATVRLVLSYERGLMESGAKASLQLGNQVVAAEYWAHESVYARAVRYGTNSRKEGFNPSALAAFIVLLLRHGLEPDEAMAFVEPLVLGTELAPTDPRLAARRWMLTNRSSPNKANKMALSAFIRSWNAHQRGDTLKILHPWRVGQPYPQLDQIVSRPETEDIR